MKISILYSKPTVNAEHEKILDGLGDWEMIDAKNFTNKEVLDAVRDSEILIPGPSGFETGLNAEILKGLKNLKFISLITVGTDWVDLDTAKELDIPVSNVKGANSESVAEHVWGMIIDLSKRITEFNRDVRDKGAYKFTDYKGKELWGKTLGLIGTGDIGKKVARIAEGFNMKVLGVNKHGGNVEGVEIVDLDILLRESDVINISVPLNDETEGMIDKEEIEKMKQDVILVNCAREEIVNKEAVLDAVESGKLFGYGVETAIMKAVPKNDRYWDYPNVLVTIHNAFFTQEASDKELSMALNNIESFLAGDDQNTCV